MAEFRFTNDLSAQDVAGVVDVLRRPRLYIPTERDYPNHVTWLEKTEAQLIAGEKRAMVAYALGHAVGTVVYRKHEVRTDVLEIRNISVSPDAKGRYVGSFLLRNSEIEGIQNDFPGTSTVMVDTKVTNIGMIDFLLTHGYELQEVVDLYGLDAGMDAVLTKTVA